MNMRFVRMGLWALVVVAGIAATAYSLIPKSGGFGQVDFDLIDHDGVAITEAAFKGQPSMLFFGFTHCPDVCPTSLSEIAYIFEGIGDEAGDLTSFFVTVDPERDTPEILKDYAGIFSDKITGITGDAAEIDKLVKAWGVYAARVETGDGEYVMDHTASIFLLDDQGKFVGTISYGEDLVTAEEKVRRLIGAS